MESGLRERKKELNRQLIADTALRLFVERGFERVAVSEIARAADVSEKTVFNYFPTKEDLVYSRLESFEAQLLEAVRDRRPGESVLTAFGRFVTEPRGLLAKNEPEVDERLRAITAMITKSPALLARQREIFERYTAALAHLLAEETGARPGDAAPRVVANALVGIHRALLDYVRDGVSAGRSSNALFRGMRAQAAQALELLERGLGEYGVRGGGPEDPPPVGI
jgi:AcrR family transcriptional regulator